MAYLRNILIESAEYSVEQYCCIRYGMLFCLFWTWLHFLNFLIYSDLISDLQRATSKKLNSHFGDVSGNSYVRMEMSNASEDESAPCNNMKETNKWKNHRDKFSSLFLCNRWSVILTGSNTIYIQMLCLKLYLDIEIS